MSDESRAVAAVYATTGEHEIVARTARQPAQLQLARRRLFVILRHGANERKAHITLYAFASLEERLTHPLINDHPRSSQSVVELEERVYGLAFGAFDSFRLRENARDARVRRPPSARVRDGSIDHQDGPEDGREN